MPPSRRCWNARTRRCTRPSAKAATVCVALPSSVSGASRLSSDRHARAACPQPHSRVMAQTYTSSQAPPPLSSRLSELRQRQPSSALTCTSSHRCARGHRALPMQGGGDLVIGGASCDVGAAARDFIGRDRWRALPAIAVPTRGR